MKHKRVINFLLIILFIFSSFTGCSGLFGKPAETDSESYAQPGKLIVVADLASSVGSERVAIPSDATGISNFKYYGRIKTSVADNPDLVPGTLTDTKINFAFATVSETSGLTLEIYAFPKTVTTPKIDDAVMFATVENLSIIDAIANVITISQTISLKPYTDSGKGTIDLAITLPESAYTLEVICSAISPNPIPAIQDGVNWKVYIGDVDASEYEFIFVIKNATQDIYGWTETVVVYKGLTTNVWKTVGGNTAQTQSVSSSEITNESNTFYVCGGGNGWYSENLPAVTGDDSNPGTVLKPMKTLQAAINKACEIGGAAAYSRGFNIYVDGLLTAESGSGRVANIDYTGTAIMLNIKGIGSGEKIATLDAKLSSTSPQGNGSVVTVNKSSFVLTLENLKITGGNTTGNGGGIDIEQGTVKVCNCEITGNKASGNGNGVYNGTSLYLYGTIKIPDGIYMDSSVKIYLGASLAAAPGETKVTTITPYSYDTANTLLQLADSASGSIPSSICDLFDVTPDASGDNWKFNASGCLEKVYLSPAEVSDFLQNYTGTYPVKLAVQIDKNNAESDFAALKTALDAVSESVELELSDGITKITNNAFQDCQNLKSVTIPASVTSIGDFAFADCKFLASVTIPASVTSIGAYAFDRCSSLASVIFGDPTGWTYESGRETLAANFSNNYQRNAICLTTLGGRSGFSKQTS